MKIHLFGKLNGAGLEADYHLLEKELTGLGHEVKFFSFEGQIPLGEKADYNVHLEAINASGLESAPLNYFIANPEWYVQDMEVLDKIDLVLCKTYEALRIFQQLGYNTYYLGFTSVDCHLEGVKKDFHQLLHPRGGSHTKGTLLLLRGWVQFSSALGLPHLTVTSFGGEKLKAPSLKIYDSKLPLEEYRFLQNHCGIHLCPSETEGFGHAMVEAMSTGAVVITLDAPPMNEFIQDKDCLVPSKEQDLLSLAVRYTYDARDLIKVVQWLVSLPPERLQEIGQKNRQMYLQNHTAFKERLKVLFP